MNPSSVIPATILNVDDNEASLYVKTRVLRRAGFQVVEANRGSRVMPLIETHQPDLVLLDVNLPDGSGYDVCRAIKSDPNHGSIIVVHISASFVDRNDRLKGFAAGADSYLTEPMEADELVANVSALLRLRKMEHELRQSAIEWQKTFEAVRDGVAIVQESGTVSRCNPAFTSMSGGKPGDALAAILPADAPLQQLFTECTRTKSGSQTDLEMTDRAYRLSIDPVLDPLGQVTHFACILSDVTAEREIARLNEQLRRASRAKDDFLATVSHELRTPMTSIIGWAQSLQMFGAHEESRQAAEAILMSARAQAALVEDLLDLSRITTGKLRLEIDEVDLENVVESAIQTISPVAAAKRIAVGQHLHPVSVAGDRNRLQQVVWNLLTNAVKFTPANGRIEVRVSALDSRAEICVSDSGQGIDADFLPEIFDRFTQWEEINGRSTGGLGLGLAIVRHLVELHGGEVTAESAGKGLGATFRVLLPMNG